MFEHNQFMAVFSLPQELPDDFFDLLEAQQQIAAEYIISGKLVNYAMSSEKSKIWAIFNADSEMEVMEMLFDFPLTSLLEVEISLLSSFNFKNEMAPFCLN